MTNNEDDNKLQEIAMGSNEAAAKALLQIAKETSTQLGKHGVNQEVENYTLLTKAALESYDLEATKHMDKRELDKQKTIREQRRTKELAALAADANGNPVENPDERLLVSPLGLNENQTVPAVTYTQGGSIQEEGKGDEDENINRLVQENKDDN